MDWSSLKELFDTWFSVYFFQLVVTVLVVTACLVAIRISKPKLEKGADQSGFKEGSATKAINLVRLISSTVGVLILSAIWGIDLGVILIFASTTLTILGVAFFASWSLLSHVTAYVILLLHPSFRRGTFIRVIDADNYAEGYISELTMFNMKLVTENREIIVYPNNLLLGRPSIINPRDRLDGVGKLRSAIPVVEDKKLPESVSSI